MRILLILKTFFFLCIGVYANGIQHLNNRQIVESNYTLIENSTKQIKFVFELNSYQQALINTPKGVASIISASGATQIFEKGAPDLSKFTTSLILPDNNKMKLKVSGTDFIEISDIDIAPSKGHIKRNINPSSISFEWGDSYQKDTFYPGNLATLEQVYVLRDFRGQAVNIYPFQYNPHTRVLRIYSRFEITLSNTGILGDNPKLISTKKTTKLFNKLYAKQFLNFEPLKYSQVSENGNMLIICHPDYLEQMDEFVTWKRQKGQQVEMVNSDDVGVSSSTIYSYVKNYYETKGLTFLLLVGDANYITPMYKSGDSDAAYGHLEGNDSYAEVIVGRFSAQSSLDLQVQIDKTIYYERDIDETATWLSNAIGIASNEGGNGIGDDNETDKVHMDNIRTDLQNYGYATVNQIYDPGATYLDVKNAIEDGRSLINYVGHGSDTEWVTSGFSVSKINELENIYKYPFIFDVACVNGNFKGKTCFAEAFMRAKKDSIGTGAVAIIASTINQDWAPPMDAQDEMVDILTNAYEDIRMETFGGLTINGCMHMNDNYGASGSNMTNTWTIFGDPSLTVRTKTPEKIEAFHSSVIIIGMDKFEVNSNFDGTLVVLSNADTIIASALVSQGIANLDISELSEEQELVLTISGFNNVTYQSKVNVVISDGPYLLVNNVNIIDSESNNNGQLEYGEEVKISFNIHNVGLALASNIKASLISESLYATLNPDCVNQSVGSIDVSENIVLEKSFTVKVGKNTPDQHMIEFDLVLFNEDSTKVWTKNFGLVCNASDFSFGDVEIAEVSGNNNNRIDPGEEAILYLPFFNNGHSNANDFLLNFKMNNPYITIKEYNYLIENIEIGKKDTLELPLIVNENTPTGIEFDYLFEIVDGNSFIDSQSIVIGALPLEEVGSGEENSYKYPFYNYYSSNRTQIIYTLDDLGGGEKTIDAFSLFLNRITQDVEKRVLSNFTVKFMHANISEHTSTYVNTDNAQTVFNEDYLLPGHMGEIIFDIDDFEYNGSDNLLVDLTWGENDYFVSNDSYTVFSTLTDENLVAYGYQDNTANPSFKGVSKARPNTNFYYKSDDVTYSNIEFLVINSGYDMIHENAIISIGSLELITNAEGKVQTSLAVGNYNAIVYAGYSKVIEYPFEANEETQLVILDMVQTNLPNDKHNDFTVYPNPANNLIYFSALRGIAELSIYNSLGAMIQFTVLSDGQNSIDISKLKKGVYLLNIYSEERTYSRKILKQ